MPKAIVTTELSDIIKTLRTQNKIQSKSVAEHINKSPAYVSKLEKSELKTIDTEELSSILHFITVSKNDSNTAEEIYNSLKIKYSNEEIESQIWFRNFDTIIRKIPVPSDLIDCINGKMAQSRISREYLLSRINANEVLSDIDKLDSSKDNNQWFRSNDKESNLKYSIKICMTIDQLNNLLDKTTDLSPYMFVFCTLFYVNKIVQYGSTITLAPSSYVNLYNSTTSELNSYKFFSISTKQSLLEQEHAKSNKNFDYILNTFDKENLKYIQQILGELSFASQYNIKYANEKLSHFSKNLKWDLGFMLAIVSMDYNSLDNITVSNKKALLSDITKVIEKYKELPSSQNRIEEY